MLSRCVFFISCHIAQHSVQVGAPLLVVLEYCEKGELRSYLVKTTDISDEQRLKFALECAVGLQYLASKGFIHRDVYVSARSLLH